MSIYKTIYLDSHATTPVDPRVVDEMLPYFTDQFGNAASRTHRYGWDAEEVVRRSRGAVAKLIGAADAEREVVFTSGATESNNLAIKGVARANRERGDHIITQKTEHTAVLDTCRRLEGEGFRVTYLDVDADGCVDPDSVAKAIDDRTILISVMFVNNEVGTVHPVKEIGAIARNRGVLFHCDAVQGLGVLDFDVESLHVDLASLSAHKMYGPKGIGALYIRKTRPRIRLVPEMDGGGHEGGYRSGTLNVPLIAGFGKAAELVLKERKHYGPRILAMRQRLHERLVDGLGEVVLNGTADPNRHPGNLNICMPGVEAEALMMAVKDVAVSSGSACTSTKVKPSYVLLAMGRSEEQAYSSLRFGVSRFNSDDQIEQAASRFVEEARRLRGLAEGSAV